MTPGLLTAIVARAEVFIITLPVSPFLILTAVFGACVGSFLNVVIYRLPVMMQRDWRKQAREILELSEEPEQGTFNLVLPNSCCPNCGHPLQHATLAGYRVTYCERCKYKTQTLAGGPRR